MTPSAVHTFRLWLSLARLPTDPELRVQTQRLLEADVRSPLTDVTAEWEGQSLLLAAMPSRIVRVNEGPTVDLAQPLQPQSHEPLPLALIERGVNPWQRLRTTTDLGDDPNYLRGFYAQSVPQGFGPALMALRTQSWATLAACLRHPQRPDWRTVMAHRDSGALCLWDVATKPGLVKALLEGGLPINEQDAEGNTLLHRVQSAPLALWLIAQGADVHVTNQAGLTPLQAQEKGKQLTPELRRVLAQAHTDTPIEAKDIWSKALTGKGAEIFPYFSTGQAGLRELVQWRWETKAGTVNLLDAASLAAARWEDSSRPLDQKPEFALINRLLAQPTAWPAASLALARLALQHQPDEQYKRIKVDDAHLHPLSVDDRLLGMRQFVRLSSLPVPVNSEHFSAWIAPLEPTQRREALDEWLTWAQQRTPSQWRRASSVGRKHLRILGGVTPLRMEVNPPEGMSAPQHAALLGEVVVSQLAELTQRNKVQNARDEQVQAIKAMLPTLAHTLHAAGVSLQEPTWASLAQALKTTAAGVDLDGEITALLRVKQLTTVEAPTRHRRRLRS